MAGYLSRLRSDAVSRHTVAPLPEWTRAEMAAKVYDQTWQAPTGTVTSFSVLALDAEHAETLGVIRLGGDSRGLLLRENVMLDVDPDFDAGRAVNVLRYETEAEREHRRARYAQRAA